MKAADIRGKSSREWHLCPVFILAHAETLLHEHDTANHLRGHGGLFAFVPTVDAVGWRVIAEYPKFSTDVPRCYVDNSQI